MIFQNSNKKPAQDESLVAMPNMQSGVNDAANKADQGDQELARVLADINGQVNANNNLMTDLETISAAEAVSSSADVVPMNVTDSNDQVAEDAVMSGFQSANVSTTPGLTGQTSESQVLFQPQVSAFDQQTSNVSTNSSANLNQPLESTPAAESMSVDMTTVNEEAGLSAGSSSTIEMVSSSDLDQLRKQALNDLRPIVDKIELNNEESFDLLLLLIRETDDESLLPRAYETARQIQDETRRAQALLDVIKEADYFKHKA